MEPRFAASYSLLRKHVGDLENWRSWRMETALAIVVGLGLAAATGFRLFLPFLVLGIAARTDAVPLASGFQWIATTPALIAFATATLVEALAYAIPWVDHMLDALATPLSVLAGVVASAAVMTDLPPLAQWSLAIVAGGGTAGFVQGATILARLNSALFTGGVANPVVAAFEFLGSLLTAILALLVPLLGLAVAVALCAVVFRASHRIAFGRWNTGKDSDTPVT
jgi:hypothetical protein